MPQLDVFIFFDEAFSTFVLFFIYYFLVFFGLLVIVVRQRVFMYIFNVLFFCLGSILGFLRLKTINTLILKKVRYLNVFNLV